MKKNIELLLATHNLHKVREYRDMLEGIAGLDILSLHDFSHYEPPEETGSTFEENALLKAKHAADAFDKYVLADDSGLVVPALEGAPGVFSARYAGADQRCDKKNRLKLLKEMSSFDNEQRSAYFECCIALVGPNGLQKSVRGICEGRITDKEIGGNGFGYDPLFIKNGYTKTFAQIDEATKNRISHRRKAFDKLLLTLEALNEEMKTL